MKLEVGKFYVLFNGEVKECTRFSEATDDDAFFLEYGRFVLGLIYYHEDGTFADGTRLHMSVSHEYKEETTVEYKTFGEMTDEEKGALLLAQYEGKTIELLSTTGNWVGRGYADSCFYKCNTYRVKVEPVITTGSRTGLIVGKSYTFSYTLVDGVPDCSKVTMVKSVTT
jgi:hypothetical protein